MWNCLSSSFMRDIDYQIHLNRTNTSILHNNFDCFSLSYNHFNNIINNKNEISIKNDYFKYNYHSRFVPILKIFLLTLFFNVEPTQLYIFMYFLFYRFIYFKWKFRNKALISLPHKIIWRLTFCIRRKATTTQPNFPFSMVFIWCDFNQICSFSFSSFNVKC